MNVTCPKCDTTYRVDPAKVPSGGVRARCTECGEVIEVRPAATGQVGAAEPETEAAGPGRSGLQDASLESASARAAHGDATRAAAADAGGGGFDASAERFAAESAADDESAAPDAASEGTLTRFAQEMGDVGSSAPGLAGGEASGTLPDVPGPVDRTSPGGMAAAGGPSGAGAPTAPERQSPPAARAPRPAPAFGATDPDAKARRLARALISDIVVYHPERRERSLEAGSLRQDFREEIQKSWEEYVAQVGDATARGTTHFRDALNEILAGGRRVF